MTDAAASTPAGAGPGALALADAEVDALLARLDAGRDADAASLDAAVAAAEGRLAEDVPRGLAAVERVRRAVDRHGDDRRRAIVRRLHARALAMSTRFDDALAAAADAVSAAEAAGDAVLAGRGRMVQLHALARLGRVDEAAAAGVAARATFDAAGETVLAAKCDANLGETYRLASDPASALACFDRAAAVLGAGTPETAPLETNRGQALLDLNRFDEAEAAFRRAGAGFEAGGNRVGAAICEGNLGDLLAREGRIDGALRHFERARRFFERSGAAGDLARLEAEHAELLALRGALDESIDAFRAALPALRRHGLRAEAARAATSLARVLVRRRRLSEARETIAEARSLHAELGHAAGIAVVELAAGERAIAAGDPAAARPHLEQAIAGLADRPVEAARARHALGVALRRLGDPAGAARVLDAARAEADRHGVRPLLADVRHARGLVHRDAGERAEAAAELRAAIDEIEAIRGSLQAQRFRATFLGDRTAAFDDLVDLLVADGSPAAVAEAFLVSGRARGRTLLDLLVRRPERPSSAGEGSATLAAQLERALARLDALWSRLPEHAAGVARVSVAASAASAAATAGPARAIETASPAGAATPAAPAGPPATAVGTTPWREELARAEQDVRRLETRLAATAGADARLGRPLGPDEIAARLRPGATLVCFHGLADRTVAFVIDDAGLRAIDLPVTAAGRAELVADVGFQIRRAMAYPDAERDDPELVADARAALGRAHAALLAPLDPAIREARELVVVPHGPLHDLPFHALHDGRAHLVERLAVRTLPAASLLAPPAPRAEPGPEPAPAHADARARAAGPTAGPTTSPTTSPTTAPTARPSAAPAAASAVVLGAPDVDAPDIAGEIAAVAAALGPRAAVVDAAATRARLLDAAPGAGLLHVASHGRFSELSPDGSGLRMADGWVTVRDLRRLELDGAAVVLSGCDTGRSLVEAADELAGLDRGLLAAGARGIVRSLWPLHDAVARGLMTDAYAHWTDAGPGASLFDAIRAAQRELLRRRPHPFLWAALACVGDA